MDLFEINNTMDKKKPLADRMRPQDLNHFVGQENILGPGNFLNKIIATDNLVSMILFGPPGTGKTTLAHIIANKTQACFQTLNAVSSGVGDIRKMVEEAKNRSKFFHQRTILFIDEIHRFNKTQQDALLPYVENGTVILIGATTENPYFEVNSALLSRTKVVRLRPLEPDEIVKILKAALSDIENGLGSNQVRFNEESLRYIANLSGGDGRRSLNILEQVVFMLETTEQLEMTVEVVQEIVGEKVQLYDKQGDYHFDVVSAFIKSMRGSDPNAALHYLARMLESGEDVKFIARRIVICAAEDVGLADPQALIIATSMAQAVQFLGMPEARIPLSQAVIYIATAPKSNTAYIGIDQALNDVRHKDCGQVPLDLRDSHYSGAKDLGHGQQYLYPHDFTGGFVCQQYLPDNLSGTIYYQPTSYGKELQILERMELLRKKC